MSPAVSTSKPDKSTLDVIKSIFSKLVFSITSDIFFVPFKTLYIDLSEFSKLDNPNPVVALPCGSKSITKTLLPFMFKPAARFITVVVFPYTTFLIYY